MRQLYPSVTFRCCNLCSSPRIAISIRNNDRPTILLIGDCRPSTKCKPKTNLPWRRCYRYFHLVPLVLCFVSRSVPNQWNFLQRLFPMALHPRIDVSKSFSIFFSYVNYQLIMNLCLAYSIDT